MIRKDNCFQIGAFAKVHGLKGELILAVENDFPERYSEEPIFIDIDGGLVPFFIEKGGLNTRNHTSYRIKLEGVDSGTLANRLVGVDVFLQKDLFEEEDMMNLSILEGFTVIDKEKGKLGKIEFIEDFSGNIVFTVLIDTKEVMIPLVEEQVVDVDYDKEIIELDLPEGLLDIYL